MQFSGDHAGGVLGATRRSSTRRLGRRCLPGGCAMFQWAVGLDMARGSLETDEALVEVAVDADMAKFPALETGLVIVEVVLSQECVMVAASPPDFSASNGSFFIFGQGG